MTRPRFYFYRPEDVAVVRDASQVVGYRVEIRKDHMTEGNGEQHTHEETVKDEHTNEDGTVTVEKTETTEAESNGDE